MKFFFQFKPAAQVAYFCVGFLFFPFIQDIRGNLYLFLVSIILFLLFILCGYFRLAATILGFSCSFIYFFILSQDIKSNSLTEEDFYSLSQNKKILITFQKENKRNFYEAIIKAGTKEFRAIIKRKKKDSLLPSFQCDPNSILLKKESDKEEYFRFLEKFNFQFIQIREKKCEMISYKIDPRKSFKFKTESLLERAGITDYANDIAMGLFFGDASYLENEFKEKAREGGILHLFAASGLHIGVFMGFLFFFAKRLPFLNYYTERIVPILFAFIYLYLLNFPISLMRAYVFASIYIIGNLFFRKMKSIDLILVSAAILLLLDKESFLTLSFNLSYFAVAGILFLKKNLDELFFGKIKNFFTENFSISLSASLGTYPVLLFYFKSFSFGSIFLNLILVPLTSLVLPLLYISLFFQFTLEQYLQFIFSWNKNLFNLLTPVTYLFQIGIEILWSYSEFILRSILYLSDHLSSSVGFYRTVFSSYLFHLKFYLFYLILLLLSFILLEKKFFLKEKTSLIFKKYSRRFSILSFLFLICFFYFGYTLYPDSEKNHNNLEVSAGSDYYIVRDKNEIYLGGICKYSEYKIQKLLKEKFCTKTIHSIYIEEESCLSLASLCQSKSIDSNLYSKEKLSDWEKIYPFLSQNQNASKRNFNNLILFYPHIDSLYELQRNTRLEGGKIILLFAYRLNDNTKDWNQNKNLLGINPKWNFITPDEL